MSQWTTCKTCGAEMTSTCPFCFDKQESPTNLALEVALAYLRGELDDAALWNFIEAQD